MKTVTVTALQKHPYDGIDREVGDVYECDEQFLPAMEIYGNVKRIDSQTLPAEQEEEKPKRYKRRDMRAEE